jgi:DUF4097 and DUF4098 domain-containing protein YvlB
MPQSNQVRLPPFSFLNSQIKELIVDMDSGQVMLVKSPDGIVKLTGTTMDPRHTFYKVQPSEGKLIVTARVNGGLFHVAGEKSVNMLAEIPAGMNVRIKSFNASILANDLDAILDINSIAGGITLDHFNGQAILISGRGNISVKEGVGVVNIIGEHGKLEVVSYKGEVSMSTIMGMINYVGSPGTGDKIHLETDHGPVIIEIGERSNIKMSISTTSGSINCLSPEHQIVNGCIGTIGDGSGDLTVRTVSGAVSIKGSQTH